MYMSEVWWLLASAGLYTSLIRTILQHYTLRHIDGTFKGKK